jgi:hypothetical protein
MRVVAYVDGRPCGAGRTHSFEGKVIFVVDAPASCGATGRPVTIEVGAQVFETIWGNTRLVKLEH